MGSFGEISGLFGRRVEVLTFHASPNRVPTGILDRRMLRLTDGSIERREALLGGSTSPTSKCSLCGKGGPRRDSVVRERVLLMLLGGSRARLADESLRDELETPDASLGSCTRRRRRDRRREDADDRDDPGDEDGSLEHVCRGQMGSTDLRPSVESLNRETEPRVLPGESLQRRTEVVGEVVLLKEKRR